MAEPPMSPLVRRQSTPRKKVQFDRMYEPHHHHHHHHHYRQSTENEDNELANEVTLQDKISPTHSRTKISRQGDDLDMKQTINTDSEQFDALFARSNVSPPPSPHPRCYSSGSPYPTIPSFPIFTDTNSEHHAKSQPHLISSLSSSSSPPPPPSSSSVKTVNDDRRQSTVSSVKSQSSNPALSSNCAQMKRKTFSLTHSTQAFLQSSNFQSEPLEPLARSCSYKRPQSIKKYRQAKRGKEKEQRECFSSSSRKYSTQNNNILNTVASTATRRSVSSATSRISAIDLMANDDPHDQWSNTKTNRSGRVGSLPLDQLQLPHDVDEEIYRVRQFNTTSKGFVNRGDSFKRSFKRSGSTSRRNSFRKGDRTPSQEQMNDGIFSSNEVRTSTNSLTNASLTLSGPNLNNIMDSNYMDSSMGNISSTVIMDEDDNPLVERIETEDGRVQDIRLYQVYLLGMSGTGKCSLLRQFKTTEYRGIYDYSSSVEDDPDNTVSIMLDGIESRLHMINIDVDLIKCSVTGDAFVVVYSITDRQSFQTAVQLIKNIREKELEEDFSSIKPHVPIILVGNKSDLVRKRAVTKETARHAAFRHDCKFVETSAAINDKVDDLLAGTLKQIRLSEHKGDEQRRRLTVHNGVIDVEQFDNESSTDLARRKTSAGHNSNSKNFFSKFLNVFRKKPTRVPADVENLNIGTR